MTKMSQCSTCIGDGVHCEHYRPTDDSPCPNYIFDTNCYSPYTSSSYWSSNF